MISLKRFWKKKIRTDLHIRILGNGANVQFSAMGGVFLDDMPKAIEQLTGYLKVMHEMKANGDRLLRQIQGGDHAA